LYPRTQDIDDGVLQITSYMVPVIDINWSDWVAYHVPEYLCAITTLLTDRQHAYIHARVNVLIFDKTGSDCLKTGTF
jgi:hypothetical protein